MFERWCSSFRHNRVCVRVEFCYLFCAFERENFDFRVIFHDRMIRLAFALRARTPRRSNTTSLEHYVLARCVMILSPFRSNQHVSPLLVFTTQDKIRLRFMSSGSNTRHARTLHLHLSAFHERTARSESQA